MLRAFVKLFMGVFLLAVGVFGGVALDRQVLLQLVPVQSASASTGLNYSLINQAWNLIQGNYVDRKAIQPTQLTYGAISGMVDALGDTGHSRFMSPQDKQNENNQTQGQFEGVGIEVEMVNGQVKIVSPIDGSPAQQAGLRSGEIILKVNGQDISGWTLDQVANQILGPAGTQVTLTIQDPTTGDTQDYTLTRAKIKLQNVTWQKIPGTTIADVRIAAFSQGVTGDLQNALADMKAQGITGIVLDLRDNPGGLLDEAIGVSSEFISKGNVLMVMDSKGNKTPVPVKPSGPVSNLPMVVLINRGTASAAEIVSGALSDNQRATLVGETTFGTGTVLEQYNLSDGSALLLANEEWLTPNGQTIGHKGITPTNVVQLPNNATMLTPETLKDLSASQLQSSTDSQFLQALNLVENTALQK